MLVLSLTRKIVISSARDTREIKNSSSQKTVKKSQKNRKIFQKTISKLQSFNSNDALYLYTKVSTDAINIK
jgi:predicted translin family RNA/ssDNA-binding protein